MIRIASALAALFVSSCSSPHVPEESTSQDRDIFVGSLVQINGQPVETVLKVRFFSTDGDDVADRYMLYSDCFSPGYFDQRRGVFLSGYSPIGTDAEKAPTHVVQEAADNHRARRCPDDSANFSQVLDIMYVGASLQIDGDRAKLTSKTGLSAELRREPATFIVD